MLAAGVGVGTGERELEFNGDRVPVQEGEKFGRWIMERAARQCEYTYATELYTFKWLR